MLSLQHAIDKEEFPARGHIVIAEDDDDVRFGLAGLFRGDGLEVSCHSDGELLVEHLERCRQRNELPDVLVLDHRMPGYCGLDVLEGLRMLHCAVPVILVTAFADEVRADAAALGACSIIAKPFDPAELHSVVYYWMHASPKGVTLHPLEQDPLSDAKQEDSCIICGCGITGFSAHYYKGLCSMCGSFV